MAGRRGREQMQGRRDPLPVVSPNDSPITSESTGVHRRQDSCRLPELRCRAKSRLFSSGASGSRSVRSAAPISAPLGSTGSGAWSILVAVDPIRSLGCGRPLSRRPIHQGCWAGLTITAASGKHRNTVRASTALAAGRKDHSMHVRRLVVSGALLVAASLRPCNCASPNTSSTAMARGNGERSEVGLSYTFSVAKPAGTALVPRTYPIGQVKGVSEGFDKPGVHAMCTPEDIPDMKFGHSDPELGL